MSHDERVVVYYQHYKGGRYVIERIAKAEWNPHLTLVIYRNIDTDEVWAREYNEFHGYVTDESGKTVKRFTPVYA